MGFLDSFVNEVASFISQRRKEDEEREKELQKTKQVFTEEEFTTPKGELKPSFIDSLSRDVGQAVNVAGKWLSGGYEKEGKEFAQNTKTKLDTFVDNTFNTLYPEPPSWVPAPVKVMTSIGPQILKGQVKSIIERNTTGTPQQQELVDLRKKYIESLQTKQPTLTKEEYKRMNELEISENMELVMGLSMPHGGAGEAGKGFGKVSDSVVKSLDTAAKTAKNQQTLLSNIDDVVRKAVADNADNPQALGSIKSALLSKFKDSTNTTLRNAVAEHVNILDDIVRQITPKGVSQAASSAAPSLIPNIKTSAGDTSLPSSVRATNISPSSSTMTTSPLSKYRPGASIDDVLSDPGFIKKYSDTTAEQPFLQSLLDDIAGKREHKAAVKEMATAAQKILRKLPSKPDYDENRIADMLRGNVVAENADDARALIDNISKKAEVVSVENYVDKASAWGYQGVNVNIKTPNGNLAEVQIHTPLSRTVQDALHGLYEQWRNEKAIPKAVYEQSKQLAIDAERQFFLNNPKYGTLDPSDLPLVDTSRFAQVPKGLGPDDIPINPDYAQALGFQPPRTLEQFKGMLYRNLSQPEEQLDDAGRAFRTFVNNLKTMGKDDADIFADIGKVAQGVTEARGGMKFGKLPDIRPSSQKEIENLMNQGKLQEAKAYIDQMADDDPYKQSMKSLVDMKLAREQTANLPPPGQAPPPPGGSIPPGQTPPAGDTPLLSDIKINEQGKLIKEVGQNKFQFDLKQINTPDDVKDVILKTAQQNEPTLQTARRGTISWEQTRKFADSLGMTMEDVKARRIGSVYNAEQLDAATRLMTGSAENVSKLQKQIQALREAGKEVPEQLKLELLEANMTHIGVQSSVIGARSEAGRALNSSKMLKEALQNPQSKAAEAVNKMFGGDANKTKEVIDRLATFDPDDTTGMVKFLREIKPSTPIDKIEEIWYNSILSNTATHIVNTVSNAVSTIMRIPEKVVASFYDDVITGAGNKAGMNLERDRYLAEAGGEIAGVRQGLIKGLQRSQYVMKNGFTPADATKFDMGRGQAIKGPIGNVINIPSRGLVAEDEFFKGINYEMSLWEQAIRAAKKEGLEGAAYTARVSDLVANPTPQIAEEALSKAKYHLFQSPTQTADAVRAMRDNFLVLKLGERVGEIRPLRFIVPFIQTPMNVVAHGLERTPAGFGIAAYNAVSGAGKGAVVDSLSRATIGTTVMGILAFYATEDKITGAPPKNQKERDAFFADGKQPWSIKIGDTWVAYNRVEPFNTILAQIAMWHDSFKENDDLVSVDTIADFIRQVASNAADQPFLTGIGNLVDAVEDPERFGKKFITDIIGGFVPSLVAAGTRTIDPVVRDADTFVDSLKARTPFLSKTVPARESDFEPGGEAIRKGGTLRQIFNNFVGFRTSPDLGKGMYEKTVEIRKLNEAQREQSENEKADAVAMVKEIQQTPTEGRQALIEGWIQSGRLTEKQLDRIETAIEEETLPLIGEERYLKNSSNSTRAKYLYKQIQTIKPEERAAYIDRMIENGVLTEGVVDEFTSLLQAGNQVDFAQ